MKKLVKRIKNDDRVLGEGVLKVDSFATHQVDPELMEATGNRSAEVFAETGTIKVIITEVPGIVPALYTTQKLGVPMILARKAKSLTMDEELLAASVYSFTKQVTSQISISRRFLSNADKVLVIDDFLTSERTAGGLAELCQQAGTKVEGIGIVAEESLRDNRQLLEDMGLDVVSLARIALLSEGTVTSSEEDA